MSIPKNVYHYTTRDIALEKILFDKKIRLDSQGLTNDPRETKTWGFLIMNPPRQGSELDNLREAFDIINTANSIRLKEWWVLCMTINDLDLVLPKPNQPDVTHFKYGYARPRMWAQYSDNHTGVCLEFDGSALDKAISTSINSNDSVFHGVVDYADEWDGPSRSNYQRAFQVEYESLGIDIFNGMRKHIRENHKHFFLRKSTDWKSEREFRWLVHSKSGPFLVDISDALKSVIVGVNFPKVYKPAIESLCNDSKIKLERMNWIDRVPIKDLW